MKTAICYYSRHHGNTLKVLEAMAEAAEIDLIDVTSRMAARLILRHLYLRLHGFIVCLTHIKKVLLLVKM